MQEPERQILATLPTPLIRLERLGLSLGDAQIWMKRDDLTGLEFSGNKIRKLEYIVADALSRGCDTLVTEGTCQSNHCRATAAVCARLGLKSALLIRPEPSKEILGNHLLDVLFGAQTWFYSSDHFNANREEIVQAVLAELKDAGRKPRWVPMGASEPLGCWGYIRAVTELINQLKDLGITECDVIVPVSSGGTYAGTLLGTHLNRSVDVRLWGVPVSDDIDHHKREITQLCSQTVDEFELPIEPPDLRMQFLEGYVGDGYAIPNAAAIRAIRLLARTEGIILDPVYTGKAFCAVLDGVQDGRLGRDRPVIFIHTGGIFSDFAWPQTLLKNTSLDGE